MLILMLFGLGMIAFGGFMIRRPIQFANGIAVFSRKKWFHVFEIVSRFGLGLVFLLFVNHTDYPYLFLGLGIMLVGVSLFLVIIGEDKHRKFALKTVEIGKNFKPIGFVSIAAGLVLVYLGFK